MPKPRSQLVSLEATTYYHCISRCVRRAFLCGEDRSSGKNFEHRKQWLVERIKEFGGIFAIDICAYAVMSNHFHLVLRIDRERAREWSDEQVAERYAKLFRYTVEDCEQLPEQARAQRIQRWRERLWDLSWFMRCLNESIARRANREDRCTGRFWEGRFRSQALLDDGALLTCMSYIDLNPIRAGMADSLEKSDFTSIQERLRAVGSPADLLPFSDEPKDLFSERLPMTRQDYIDLLRWSGGSVGESEVVSSDSASNLLERFGLEPTNFVDGIRRYARGFFTMVGHLHRIDAEAGRRGYRRCHGRRAAQKLYRPFAA